MLTDDKRMEAAGLRERDGAGQQDTWQNLNMLMKIIMPRQYKTVTLPAVD